MAMTAPRGRTQRRRRRRSDPASTRALERATHQPPPHRAGLRSSRRRARRRRRRRRRARRRTTTTMPRRLKRPPTRTSSRHAAAAAAGRHLWTRCRRLRPHRRHATRTRARRAAAPKLSSPQESTRALARRGRRRPCHSTGIMSMSRPEARLPQRLGPLGGSRSSTFGWAPTAGPGSVRKRGGGRELGGRDALYVRMSRATTVCDGGETATPPGARCLRRTHGETLRAR